MNETKTKLLALIDTFRKAVAEAPTDSEQAFKDAFMKAGDKFIEEGERILPLI